MLKNRLRILLTLIVVFTLSLNIVSAASLIDTQRVTDVYKMSDDTSEFKVPFLTFAIKVCTFSVTEEPNVLG